MICRPTGNPSPVKPIGAAVAGRYDRLASPAKKSCSAYGTALPLTLTVRLAGHLDQARHEAEVLRRHRGCLGLVVGHGVPPEAEGMRLIGSESSQCGSGDEVALKSTGRREGVPSHQIFPIRRNP